MEKETLYRFFEGNGTEQEVRQVRAWVEASPENRKEFVREGHLYDAIDLLASDDQLLSTKQPLKRNRFFREFLKAAATITIVLSMVGLWEYQKEKNTEQPMTVVHVPAGKSAEMILPDGSKVWLNAKTTLQYPSSFEKGKREVILDGEAYFEVTQDEKKPFIVHTGEYDVEVLGTSFNVQAYSFEKKSITSLMQGTVRLISQKDESTILLRPGYMAYMEDEEFLSERIVNYNPYRWKEGLICYDDLNFQEIMELFEKYYDVEIRIENDKIENLLHTGKFRQADGVEYALNVLRVYWDFNFERIENTAVIIIQ